MKISIILSLLLCLVLLSTGCGAITNDDSDKALAAWKATVESGINSLKTTVVTLQAQIAERPTTAQVDQKIAAAPAANNYTKTEIDKKIEDAIKALKDSADAPWQKKTVNNKLLVPAPDDENVLDSTSDLVLALERSVEEEFYLTDNETSPYIKLSITNNDSTSHTFRLKADFDCDDTVVMQGAILTCDYSYSSGSIMTLDGNVMGVSTSTLGFTSRRSLNSTDTTWYIGKDRTESIYLRFKPDYSEAADTDHTWSWSFTLKQVD